MRVPLLGGAYASRSVIANAQKCINYFPERNQQDSPVPVTHYQRPGLRRLAVPDFPAAGRGIFRASNGNGYYIVGGRVYFVTSAFVLQQIGSLDIASNTNPVSFVDNGIEGLLVDGTPSGGWVINLATNAFAKLVDPTGTFMGADRVDFLDTYILMNVQGTNRFLSTLSNSTSFDPAFVAAKSVWPDHLAGLVVNRREILLLGDVKSEVWYDAGPQLGQLIPFAINPGAYVEHGVLAKYSIATQDVSTYWLGQNLQGVGVVFRHSGYKTERISNHALEVAIRKMAVKQDAIGYCYQQDGHTFYVLQFPSSDRTWVFDEASAEWHQRAWTDAEGRLRRDRSNCHANLYGRNVVGDWENGSLYELDLELYEDEVVGDEPRALSCVRTFPHIMYGTRQGQPIDSDGNMITYSNFRLDIDVGEAPDVLAGVAPSVTLRISRNRGRAFNEEILQSVGEPGEFDTQPQWRANGIARDMVFEVAHSLAGQASLNGAWVETSINTH